ncbi:unnamed protein product [Tenebrio molitor]|nr:unnamed protein product [Tenebrio molitor]
MVTNAINSRRRRESKLPYCSVRRITIFQKTSVKLQRERGIDLPKWELAIHCSPNGSGTDVVVKNSSELSESAFEGSQVHLRSCRHDRPVNCVTSMTPASCRLITSICFR